MSGSDRLVSRQAASVRKNPYLFGSILCIFLSAAAVLAGCASSPAMATIPFIPLERTVTRPAQAATHTSTAEPAVTEPTATPSAAFSQTQAGYMNIDFSQVKILQGGFLSGFRYFVSFKFPVDVQGEYHALVDRNKEYTCTVLPDYPDRLYCSGPLVVVYNWADIDLYAEDIEEPVFSGEFFVPRIP